ncbi:hypothetical protein ASG68_08160 [Rhizobium sp. Leaf453]|nr:hypothetical protein ASG68_08160 [Rhizobium sp. Leaf453]
MIPTSEEILRWRDGNTHKIGPLTLRYRLPEESMPSGECFIETEEGAAFRLDWMDAEALAWCIFPSADLWGAHANDPKLQSSGSRLGWLRFKMTSDPTKLGSLTGWSGKVFQFSRLLFDAGVGEVVRPVGQSRTLDYRRQALRKVGGPASADTRTSFVHCCAAFAKHRNPEVDIAGWQQQAIARFHAADQMADYVANEGDDD